MMYFKWFGIWIVSLILVLFPLPEVLALAMPSWVFLILLYQVMVKRTTTESLWILLTGLMLDVMQYNLLGEHVFALALSLWVAKLRLRRFHTLPINQQLVWVAMVTALYQLTLLILNWMLRDVSIGNAGIACIFSVILTTLLWPGLCTVLNQWLPSPPSLRGAQRRSNPDFI